MTLFERIRSLAAKGYGAEDISVMLDLKGEFNIRNIRNIVFGDFDVSTQTTRGSASASVTEKQRHQGGNHDFRRACDRTRTPSKP